MRQWLYIYILPILKLAKTIVTFEAKVSYVLEPHKGERHPTNCDVINDVKLFQYRRIYCRKFWRYPIRRRVTKASALDFGDTCIQKFHFGKYIVRYTVRNLILRRRASGAIKRDFRPCIRRYTSPNENFEYVIPILMHCFCSFVSNLSVANRRKPHVN